MIIRWVVLANTVTAHIYQLKGNHVLLLETLNHPEGCRKNKDLSADRAGQYNTSYAHQISSYSPAHNPKEIEEDRFAGHINAKLEQARNAQQFQHLTLIAPPHFWGVLAKHFSKPLKNSLDKVIQKNIINNLSHKEREDFILHAHRPLLSFT